MQEKMFHFWFNTYFVVDEETTALLLDCATTEPCSPTSSTKMNVTRTRSDQTRVVDRIAAEQRRLRRQVDRRRYCTEFRERAFRFRFRFIRMVARRLKITKFTSNKKH